MNKKTTLRNNIMALAFHILMAVLSMLLFYLLRGGLFWLLVFLVSLGYIAGGFWMLKPVDKHAVLSVLSVFAGLMLWNICVAVFRLDVFNFLYANPIYVIVSSVLNVFGGYSYRVCIFLFSAIPSLLMWLGMVLKKRVRAAKESS